MPLPARWASTRALLRQGFPDQGILPGLLVAAARRPRAIEPGASRYIPSWEHGPLSPFRNTKAAPEKTEALLEAHGRGRPRIAADSANALPRPQDPETVPQARAISDLGAPAPLPAWRGHGRGEQRAEGPSLTKGRGQRLHCAEPALALRPKRSSLGSSASRLSTRLSDGTKSTGAVSGVFTSRERSTASAPRSRPSKP